MNRRSWILGGAGLGAAIAGLAWQQSRSRPSAPAAALDEASSAFWQSSFPQPDGQNLALASLRGQPLVLNFWATWCPPCVKEMPELDRFARQFAAKGGRVLGLAVDNPTAVRDFLKRTPVSYAIGLAGFDGTDLSRRLGNSSGALPFTAVFDKTGAVAHRKLGETSFDELDRLTRSL
jgi:thiol-disulfide isomerase/thioredoxin